MYTKVIYHKPFHCQRCGRWIGMGETVWSLSPSSYDICQICYDDEPTLGIDRDKWVQEQRGQKRRIIRKPEPQS
jgi:hypothetical protein